MVFKNVLSNNLDMKLSQKYVKIVLGMDLLYRNSQKSIEEETLDSEGLVPVNLTNETPNRYNNWDEVLSALIELRNSYLKVTDEVRRNYMQQQIGSLVSIVNWCQDNNYQPFRERVRNTLYVNENTITSVERSYLHDRLEKLLTKKGFQGDLSEKLKKWEEEQKIEPHDIENVLSELLNEAKQLVAIKMFPLVEDVKVTPKVVFNVPYSAYCDYKNKMMYINGDLTYTYSSLKHLVAHESFPGHTTHLRIRELLTVSGDIPLDAALVITNTASSSIFEGIGDNGIHFINWFKSLDDQIFYVYQMIRLVSGLNASHMIHAEQRSDTEVRNFLKTFAFGEDSWVDSRMRFFKHPLRSTFIYGYWRGYEAVNHVYRKVPDDKKNFFYDFLYKNMLSADTVKHFSKELYS